MADWFYANGDTRSGPYSEAEMQGFAAAGRFNAGTLCWTASFGETWRPVSGTPFAIQPDRNGSLPPAVPVRGGSNQTAWIVGVSGAVVAIVLLAFFAPAILRLLDPPATSGRPSVAVATPPSQGPAPPPTAQPGSASQNPSTGVDQSPREAKAPATPVPDVESDLPKCDSGVAEREVTRIANTLDSLKSSGRTALSLADQQQVSSTAILRSCKGTVLLSDQTQHKLTYSFEPRPGTDFYVRLLMEILPACQSLRAQGDVIRLADTLPNLKNAGLTAVSLGDQTETGNTDTLRSCKGTLLLSDGTRHSLTYTFEQRTDQVYAAINVQ